MASHDESPSFEARVDELYALPLDEFIGGRKRLAGELKREGAADQARRFNALAKPTLSAWLTNQTVRQAPDLVRELLGATDAVAAAQRNLTGAKNAPTDFAAAVATQRKILAQLAAQARTAAAKLGHAAAGDVLDRVANNFRWGPIASDDREALSRGRLVKDVAAPGFGGFGEALAVDQAQPRLAVVPSPAPQGHPKADARHAAETARAAAAQAERERREAIARHNAALREAQHEVASARRELTHAERDRAAAGQRVATAEAALASARETLDLAEQRHRDAAVTLAKHEATEAELRRQAPGTGD